MGQRKKNQRKTRNKRRSQERRASESENSEGEAEKEREKKTEEIKQENELEEDAISTVQEHEEPTPPEPQVNSRDHQATTKPSPKGKRKNRKGGNALQSRLSGFTQVEFGNDLIFDLDM